MSRLALLVALAACSTPPPPAKPAAPAPQACIADTLGPLSDRWQPREDCGGANSACDRECRGGDGNACFNRAIAMEAANVPDRDVQPIFQRSCTLGLALGCTNYAASAWITHSVPWGCLYQVFEKTCITKDGFGCAMRGRLLIESAHDVSSGRNVLEQACEELKGPPCHFLANYISDGTLDTPDPARVDALMHLACDGGDRAACGATSGWNK